MTAYRHLLTMLCFAGASACAAERPLHVALIFDDGPTADQTAQYLALFAQQQIHVTFGQTAKNAQNQPLLSRRVVAEGHEIANHSFSHQHPQVLDDAALEKEIVGAQRIFEDEVGVKPVWYWPPFLEKDERVVRLATAAGLKVFEPQHLIVSGDYLAGLRGDEIRTRATTSLQDGCVILFHEWRKETLEQLPAIIADLKKQGCVFQTFSELQSYVQSGRH
jgi:peptidoglycan/xylan/chitin deacetylase (PgdA/CDA1 family)